MKYDVEIKITLSGYVKTEAGNPHEAVLKAEKRVRGMPQKYIGEFHRDSVQGIQATEDVED